MRWSYVVKEVVMSNALLSSAQPATKEPWTLKERPSLVKRPTILLMDETILVLGSTPKALENSANAGRD